MIRIFNPSLDDVIVDGNPCLRGVIDPKSLSELRIDGAYQREFLSSTTRRFINKALINNQRLPDVELGMRGQEWDVDDNNDAILKSPCFIIDGQQRRGSVLEYLVKNPDYDPRLGAVIHFGTTMEWERERFEALNLHQATVTTSLLIRNQRSVCPAIATLYGLTQTDKNFPLSQRVGWNQVMAKHDLISGTAYIHYASYLHGHIGPGLKGKSVMELVAGLNRLENLISLQQIRTNTRLFWETVETCWGIKSLTSRGSTWLRNTFLMALLNMVSDHLDFWTGDDGTVFQMPIEHRNKLEKFPVSDPEIKNLAAMSGKSRETMLFQMVAHMNKGRREENRLIPRNIAELRFERKSSSLREYWRRRREELTNPTP